MAPQHLPAARQSELVIVANTLPVRREEVDGELRWAQSPGGLVSALSPIVREAGGCWVGWTGGADDAPAPFRHEGILNVAVPVSEAEVAGSYEGMCNSTLWPLYHDAVRPPEYHRHWWNPYVAVNRRFAEEVARRTAPGGRVWIHDYHLQLVPRMLRELRPDVSSGFFLHIPFPPVELFLRLPWRRGLLEGLLGADVIGFQTPAGAYNFTRLADRLIEAEPQGGTIRYQGRDIRVGAFPISIDTDRYTTAALSPEIRERAEQLQQLRRGRKIILSVDRLDYTKGIDLRLKAFLEWLGRKDRSIRDAVMVQVAVPSRERISEYQILRRDVEELVGQINGEYGELGVVPVQYLRRNLPFEELIAFYLVADVMLVTPLWRRHEPGRQGVRRDASQGRRRPGAERVRGRGRRAAGRPAGQPPRRERHGGSDRAGDHSRSGRGNPPHEGDAGGRPPPLRPRVGGAVHRGSDLMCMEWQGV